MQLRAFIDELFDVLERHRRKVRVRHQGVVFYVGLVLDYVLVLQIVVVFKQRVDVFVNATFVYDDVVTLIEQLVLFSFEDCVVLLEGVADLLS